MTFLMPASTWGLAFSSQEYAGGLTEVVYPQVGPSNFLRLAAMGGLDALTVDDQVLSIHLKGSVPTAVDSIVFELVSHVLGGNAGVDSLQVTTGVLDHNTSH